MGWHVEQAEADYWEASWEYHGQARNSGIDFGAVIEEAEIMGYGLNEGMDGEAPELYRVAAAHVALGMDEADAEAVQQHLVDAGVFPVTRQDNGTLMVENEGHQPAPEATEQEQDEALRLHSERVDTVGLDSQRDLLAMRYQQERTARLALEQELESARRLIGQGPFAIVKLSSLNALTDAGQVEVKVGFGGGITRHMLRAVLSLGQQAVADEEARTAEQAPRGQVRAVLGEQEATVRLPDTRATCPACGMVTGPYPEVHQCTGNWPAQKPQEHPVDSTHPQGWTWTS